MAIQELIELATGKVFRRSDNKDWSSSLDVGDDYEVLFEGSWYEGEKQLDKLADYLAIGVSIAGGSTVLVSTEATDDANKKFFCRRIHYRQRWCESNVIPLLYRF